MRFAAVIFDLFGTLVDLFSAEEYRRVLHGMAQAVGAPPEGFARLWRSCWNDRATGVMPSLEATIDSMCRELGTIPSPPQLASAVETRLDLTRRNLAPRCDSVHTLQWLRASGLKTGLISDCTWEVPALWAETALAPLIQAPVFSCVVGTKKPDPGIYEIACAELGVRPEQCLYVGDGDSHELTGAASVGMCPVLIRVEYEYDADSQRYDAEPWDGPRVRTLSQLRKLLA